MATKLKISQIRDIIKSAEYSRSWLTGGTSEEFRKQAVGPSLRQKIDILQALDIPPRFADDIEWRAKEIERCETVIKRWEAAQTAPAVDNRTCVDGGTRHVFLGQPSCQLCGRSAAGNDAPRRATGDEIARYVTGHADECRVVVITRASRDYMVSHWESLDGQHGRAQAKTFETAAAAFLYAMTHVQRDVAEMADRVP